MSLKTISKPGLTLCAFMLAAPVLAQDTTSDQPIVTPNGDTLDMGETVSDAREPGTLYVDEVFDDWARRCIYLPDTEDACHLYQLLKDGEGSPVAEFTMLKLPDGLQAAAGATIVVPLQTLLTQQLTIRIDSAQPKRYPFKFCTTTGCVAQIGLTAGEVAGFKKGNKALLAIVPAAAPDQVVELEVSLKGFTAGFKSLHPVAQ